MSNTPITLAEALAIIESEISAIAETESLPLSEAHSRISASHITAKLEVPSYPNAAVDGYGFCYNDLPKISNSAELKIAGVAKAGHAFNEKLPPKTALRIFTGAPIINQQIDTIIMQEDVKADEMQVSFDIKDIRKGQNLRAIGDDVNLGDSLLQQGEKINAAHIGLLSAQAMQKISVYKKLKVGLLSTGDELCEAGEKLKNAMIYDSNRPMLAELLKADGYQVNDYGIIPDNPKSLLEKLQNNDDDVILTSAAMSQGEEDHLRKIISTHGRLAFSYLKCKPGRPAGFGFIADKPIIALPGNPVAAFTIYAMLARAVLARLNGATYRPPYAFPVILGEHFNKKKGRREFVRATLKASGDYLYAFRYGKKGAGILSSIASADGFLVFNEEDGNKKQGDTASFIPMSEIISA